MKFSFPFLVAVVPLILRLAATTHGAPLSEVGPISRELSAREAPTDGFVDDLFARAPKGKGKAPASGKKPAAGKKPAPGKKSAAGKKSASPKPLNAAQLSQRIRKVQEGQTARKEASIKKASLKANLNEQTRTSLGLQKPSTTDSKKMTPQDKQAQKALGKAIANARDNRKVDNFAKWQAHKKTPAQAAQKKAEKAQRRKDRKALPEQDRKGFATKHKKMQAKQHRAALAKKEGKASTPQERNQVKNAFKVANNKKNKVADLPGRKDQFKIGPNTFSGRDARQGIFNAYLHKAHPVGEKKRKGSRGPVAQKEFKSPKRFNNERYSATHADESLRGKRPIPGARGAGLEHPIIANSHNGYTGSGDVGTGRVVLYKNKQDRRKTEYAVIGHDPSRPRTNDHYLATHTKV